MHWMISSPTADGWVSHTSNHHSILILTGRWDHLKSSFSSYWGCSLSCLLFLWGVALPGSNHSPGNLQGAPPPHTGLAIHSSLAALGICRKFWSASQPRRCCSLIQQELLAIGRGLCPPGCSPHSCWLPW